MSTAARAAGIDAGSLEYNLGSPLRLRLVAELLEAGSSPLGLEDLVIQSGRHRQDVEACLFPMVRWGVVEEVRGRNAFRLAAEMAPELRATLERVVAARSDQVARDRHVRGQVLCGMIGVDAKMQLVFEMVRQVGRLDVPVLITGETGTGKELVARAVHELSPRREAFFGAVNCATLTEELFASEMFGHVRGAFTGAVRDHQGLVERCDKGTLFLDEVGDLSLANQVKLLRVIQEGTFTRVGDERVRRSQFRLVSATNRDLRGMSGRGSFREDLYYRLNVFPIQVPSLRERVDDLPYLVEEILRARAGRGEAGTLATGVTPGAMERLRRHSWVGNVRELENVVTRAAIMAGGGLIEARHLPDLGAPSTSRAGAPSIALRSLAEVEREHIESVLDELRGNMRAAAKVLGISRTTLYKKVAEYDLDVPTG